MAMVPAAIVSKSATATRASALGWYWFVDPTLEILELGANGRYVRAAANGDVTPPGCEGLVLPAQ